MYLFLKWLHIIAIISWMCGILYLFRLFINHVESGRLNREIHEMLSGMESRLYRIITVPAMAVAWIAGIGILMTAPSLAKMSWFHIKFLSVIFLTVATLHGGKLVKTFAVMENPVPSSRNLRIMNEIPTLLMMLIVGMVIFRPFS